MKRIANIWKYELEQVFRDAGVVIFFLIVPFVYPVIYGLIYNPETVRDVPLIIVDQSASSFSREFIRKIDASPDVKVISLAANMEEAIEMVNKKEAYGILAIPSEFSKKLHTGQRTEVKLYCDMSSLLNYKAFLLATTEASLEMKKEIRINESSLGSSKMEDITNNPITYEAVAMYNPQNGFASFLLPAILILVIQQTLLLGVGMLAGTRHSLKHYQLEQEASSITSVILGKGLAYFTIYIVVCCWALVVVPRLFILPQTGSFSSITLFCIPYLAACIFFAMTLACFIKDRETPMMVFVFTSLPMLFISGISWPGSSVPQFWQWISYLFPSTFGIQGFTKLNSTGADLSLVSFEFIMLWLQAAIYFTILLNIYYKRKVKIKNNP